MMESPFEHIVRTSNICGGATFSGDKAGQLLNLSFWTQADVDKFLPYIESEVELNPTPSHEQMPPPHSSAPHDTRFNWKQYQLTRHPGSYLNIVVAEPSNLEIMIIRQKILDLLIYAGQFGGIVFGGYLRSLVGSNGHQQELTWKDVDLWFQTQDAADSFMTAAASLIVSTHTPEYNHPAGFHDYPFARRQFRLCGHDTPGAWIDVIISPDFPVDDFDINMLQGHIDPQGTISISCPPEYDCDTLQAKIIRKEAQMLPPYFQEMEEDRRQERRVSVDPQGRQHGGRRASERIYSRFICRGWIISTPEGTGLDPKYFEGPIRRSRLDDVINCHLEARQYIALKLYRKANQNPAQPSASSY